MGTLGALFATGLALGISQCMLSCAPLLLFYVGGVTERWTEGLKAALVFSLARVLAYTILGALAGFAGVRLVEYFRQDTFVSWVQLIAGAFVLLLGVLTMLGRNPQLHLCRFLSGRILNNTILSMGLLGFLIGIVPYCTPFLGILTYIAFAVGDSLLGALYGLFFGLGAALVTPLLVAGPLAALIPKLVFKSPLLLEIFRRVSGIILLIFGIRLILMQVGSL